MLTFDENDPQDLLLQRRETEDWGVVSSDDVSLGNSASDPQDEGVLILPSASEEEEEPSDDEPPVETALNLSLPHTESIPSDLGELASLHGLNDLLIHGDEASEEESFEATAAAAREGLHHRRRVLPNKRMPWLVMAAVFVVWSMASTVYLVRERNAWRRTAIQLQTEIRQLKQEQQQRQKKADPKTEPFSWETCGDGKKKESTLFVDNCWLQAKAHVELGSCADETKQSIKKNFKKIRKSLKKANRKFWNKMQDFEKSWKEFSSDSTSSGDSSSEFSPASDNKDNNATVRFKGLAKTVSIVSSVAVLSLAALFVDKSWEYLSDLTGDGMDETHRAPRFF